MAKKKFTRVKRNVLTQEVFRKICDLLEEGKSLRQATVIENISLGAFSRYIADDRDRQEQYARSRDIGADALADEMMAVAYDDAKDDKTPQAIQRARLIVDSIKWILARRSPKKYGDRLDVKAEVASVDVPKEAVGAFLEKFNDAEK